MEMKENVNYDSRRLYKIANKNRIKILDMVYSGASGHVGGALSAVDVITYLGECVIDYRSEERDRFILSKGHAVPALYAELHELGYISDDELLTFRKMNSRLQGHTNRLKLSLTDYTSGLLGQGLSHGVGMALAKKLNLDILEQGVQDKLCMVEKLCQKYDISLQNVAYIGDDINDLDVIKAVGFGCSVPNGIEEVKKAAMYVTKRWGGQGAVREVIDKVLGYLNRLQR